MRREFFYTESDNGLLFIKKRTRIHLWHNYGGTQSVSRTGSFCTVDRSSIDFIFHIYASSLNFSSSKSILTIIEHIR
jgi:hypothetical protein